MRHGLWDDVILIAWTAFLLILIVRKMLAQRKATRRELIASAWPSVVGKVRSGWVTMDAGRWCLTLNYDAFDSGHGIELWRHSFPTKDEAEYTRRALTGRNCTVHYNPTDDRDITLRWDEVKLLLADDPYVAQLVRLGPVGYRWLVGLAVAAIVGLLASVSLFGVAMLGISTCVCEGMLVLLAAAPFVFLASLRPLTRMMAVAPRAGTLRQLGFVLYGWRSWALGVALVGMGPSFLHYAPAFRALAMDADVPNKVFAGAVGVLPIPVYLFAAMVVVEGLRRLRPVEAAVGVPTTV